MSLSARIALRSSRRLAACEASAAVGGCAMGAGAAVARWPTGWVIVVVVAAIVATACAVLALRTGRRGASAIVVSERPEVGLTALDARADDRGAWRLAEGTMVGPGFSVVVLSRDDGGRRVLPVFDRDLADDDRRALHRFLRWTLRGGAGHRTADA